MAVNVFISYAPADRSYLEALEAHLAALKRQGLVSTWHPGLIGAGEARNEAIAASLDAAEVVLLLVSDAFIASDHCYEQELGRALERHRAGAARVVPILVRACDWEGTAFAGIQALPREGKAVTSWVNPDEAWKDVAQGIRSAVEQGAGGAWMTAPLASAPPAGPRTLNPREAEEAIRAIDQRLASARRRRVKLQAAGANTAALDGEILDLRRKRREGGQLHAGDELDDGRYLLLERIGRGGFATVWRALDAARGDQAVAIKVLHPNLAGDESRRERFFRGARHMAALDHPGVVRILDPNSEDSGWHYFVMELVAGEDLSRAVIGKRFPAERVVPTLLGAGEALSFAHARGLVHRDVKPANILLNVEGTPRLTDFDLVWARDTTGGTRSGALGTFLYAAPELLQHPQDADVRADVYGLGMTAVFCLHGAELPLIMIRYPERVLSRLPCSEAVRGVLRRAIDFEIAERFPDVAAFCEALRSAAEREGGEPRVEDGSRGAFEAMLRRALEEGGAVRSAIERAILEPRGSRVDGPVVIAGVTIALPAVGEGQGVAEGKWTLMWPQNPVAGAAEGPFEERGTFRCTMVKEGGGLRPERVVYRSDFFEALLPWVDIPGGEFLMGSLEEGQAELDEWPQHRVEIAAFCLAATPVTRGQYGAVVARAVEIAEAELPVTEVSWKDAIEFCNALSRLAGRQPCYTLASDSLSWQRDADGFRLPEEAEWEYACRAGTTSRYSFGDNEHLLVKFAWYAENSEGKAHPVGRKRRNPWSLYDMHGNVWEWTWDSRKRYRDEVTSSSSKVEANPSPFDQDRVVRGGSFVSPPRGLRSAVRSRFGPGFRGTGLGFRCAGPARRQRILDEFTRHYDFERALFDEAPAAKAAL